MNRHRARILLFPKRTMCAGILTLLMLPPAGAAQEKPGTIEGVVVDRVTGQSVSSAVVAVTPTDLTVCTGADGRFRVDVVTSGLHGLAVHAVGYADRVEPHIVVRPGDVTRVTLQLDPAPSSGPRAGAQAAGAPPDTAHKSKSLSASASEWPLSGASQPIETPPIPGASRCYLGLSGTDSAPRSTSRGLKQAR
jgi:Carboxypeptidase regulatory-like domain